MEQFVFLNWSRSGCDQCQDFPLNFFSKGELQDFRRGLKHPATMFAQATLARGCALRLPVQSDTDSVHLLRAADIAEMSMGLTAPHANSGCVIVRGPHIVGEGFLYGQGSKSAELQAVERAGEHARGGTAYLNLEPGDWLGDNSAVASLIQVSNLFSTLGLRASWILRALEPSLTNPLVSDDFIILEFMKDTSTHVWLQKFFTPSWAFTDSVAFGSELQLLS